MKREKYKNLRNGLGIIWVDFLEIRILKKCIQFIKFTFDINASIGWHLHQDSKEYCITFNSSIRFNNSNNWTFLNFCKNGEQHCIQNISLTQYANVYAIKIINT